MQPKKSDERWVRIGTTRYIPEIRCDGPIVTPVRLPADMVLQIINRCIPGKETVVEIDPTTKKELVLDRTNIFDPNRFGVRELPVTPMPKDKSIPEPPKHEMKVAKVEQPVIGKKVEEVVPVPPVVEPTPVPPVVVKEEPVVVEETPVVPEVIVEAVNDNSDTPVVTSEIIPDETLSITTDATVAVTDNSNKPEHNNNKNYQGKKNKNVKR